MSVWRLRSCSSIGNESQQIYMWYVPGWAGAFLEARRAVILNPPPHPQAPSPPGTNTEQPLHQGGQRKKPDSQTLLFLW